MSERVIDRCPQWLYVKIRDLMGEQLMRSLTIGTDRQDEVRRITEALDWLNLRIVRLGEHSLRG